MAPTALAISWKDHHNVLISVFEKLLEKEALVDCTLAAEGKFVKAHKIVLSACSPYLETLLNQENDKHPIIFLRDVEFEDLKTIVEFVYTGEIKVPEDHLVEFLSLAESLQIKGLGGVDNKDVEEKLIDGASQEKESTSRAAKRHHHPCSEFSDSCDENEASTDNAMPRKGVKHRKETKLKVVSVSDIVSIPNTTEKFDEVIPKVKEEVIDILPAATSPLSAISTTLELDACEINEEISEVKKEFEQVTFPEVYSDDMLPEENVVTPSVIESAQEGCSTSHQYLGLSSHPFRSDGLQRQSPYIVDDTEQLPAGYSSDPFHSISLETQTSHDNSEQQPSKGSNYVVPHWSASSMEKANYKQVEHSGGNVGTNEEDVKEVAEQIRDHPQSKSDRCYLCTKTGNSRRLCMHSSSSAEERPFKCPHCPNSFLRVDMLESHLLTHTGERPFHCPFCSATFNDKGNMRSHVRIHTGEKPYQCTYCSARFTQSTNLKRHILTHTGEKPYECTHCSKQFSQSSTLSRHLLIHTGEKPLQCTVCFARFNDSGNLKKHLRTHTGEKPYRCSYCYKCFVVKAQLKNHLRDHNVEVL